MRRRIFIRGLLLAATMVAGPGHAQQADSATPRAPISSPILTIDTERVFIESAFGRRVARDVESKGAELSTENRRIEAELAAEEESLTERRDGMTAEAFRVLADAFDQKVQATRQAQAAKGRALNQLLDKEREVFLTAAAPVLEDLMRQSGAAVVLERRSVFISANAIDVTEQAIAMLDETLGTGE
jgi:Skp family chaperone for outer membrane proteins